MSRYRINKLKKIIYLKFHVTHFEGDVKSTLPSRGTASLVTGIVSLTKLVNIVRDSKIVTPEINLMFFTIYSLNKYINTKSKTKMMMNY